MKKYELENFNAESKYHASRLSRGALLKVREAMRLLLLPDVHYAKLVLAHATPEWRMTTKPTYFAELPFMLDMC